MAASAFPNPAEILGRSATVNLDGSADTVSRRWVYRRNDTSAVPDPTAVGLPAVGTPFALGSRLRLTTWATTENDDGSLLFEATYSIPASDEGSSTGGDPKDPDEASRPEAVRLESAAWSSTRYEVDVVKDGKTGKAVVLPTGEPFESVPTTWLRGRVYEETYLCAKVPSGLLAASDTVNAAQVRICGSDIPPRCGLLTASAEQVLDDPAYRFRVTVAVEVKRNPVKLKPTDAQPTELGHDTALLLQGYKYFDASGKLQTAQEPDGRGGMRPAEAPVFLDLTGKRVANPQNGDGCFFLRVHVAPESAWKKNWFVNIE